MGGVAQLVENRIGTPVVVVSIPIVHPILEKAPDSSSGAFFCARFSIWRKFPVRSRAQAWCTQALLATLGDTLGDLLAQTGGDRFAVD